MKKIPFYVAELQSEIIPANGKKYFAKLQKQPHIYMEQLLDEITKGSSVDPDEAYTLFKRFLKQIAKHLSRGRKVQLDNLGSFRLTIKGHSELSPEEINSDSIYRKGISFQAGKLMKEAIANVKFEKHVDG